MKNLKLNIPVIVQNLEVNGVTNYHLKPVFIRYPVATNRRFDLAIRQFQKEIRYYFKGYEFNTQTSASLLWFMFNPELVFKQIWISEMVGSQLIEGNISTVIFRLKGHTFIGLPHFDYFLFLGKKQSNGKVDIDEAVGKTVRQLFKDFKKEYGKDFDPKPYFSTKKEFITHVDVNVNIQLDKFKFEKDPTNLFFSRLTGNSDFNGAVEIEKVGYDLNSYYPDELQRAFLQEPLVQRIYDIVYGQENAPLVLVGKTGVGKHTIIHEIVHRHLSDFYPTNGKKKGQRSHIWHLDPTRVISGMSIVGMWQKRLESIIKFIRQPNAAQQHSDKLLIDNIIALTRIGKSAQNNMTMADLLKPYIEKRQLHTILIANPEEWKILQEQNRRFSDLFQVIRLQEPDIETTTKIILEKRKGFEIENNCEISIKAVEQLLSIQRNYLRHEALPGSILKLLEKLSVKYRSQAIDADEVRQEFEDLSGLNNTIFDTGIRFEKDQVLNELTKELVGQEAAAKALANVIHLIKAKLTNPDKPNGSFLLIGPTGVGKTQAAKVLAKYLLGSEDYLLRFDMNEYIDEYAVQRLIGDYYNPEGILTGKVRYRPFGIVLLDEIEKAHPKVHDILLQVLDDGRLTDSLGRTVDFSNTIIIMTSNVGAKEVAAQLGFTQKEAANQAIYRKAVENRFRPEFVNRIDNIIIFKPLAIEHIYGIARLQIKELLQRDGFVRRTTILNITDDALEWVARRGYNAKMGGRALKRQIEQDLTALSAEQLLKTQGDAPIILEIKIGKNHLIPSIQTLAFAAPLPADWLPQLPSVKAGKRFFRSLLTQLERIEHRIRKTEEQSHSSQDIIVINDSTSDSVNWKYYNFKERISSAKQKIQNLMLGFRDRYFAEGPAIPLRFKASELYPKSDNYSRGVRENIRDRLFQKEALIELEEGHQFGSNKFDSLQTEFIDCYLDVQFIALFSKDFLKNRTEKIELHLASCVNGSGANEITFLLDNYIHLFNQLDIEFTLDKEKNTFIADGHGLFDLLQGEAGIHLFYQSHQNPLPIQIQLRTLERSKNKRIHHHEVVRVYDSQKTMLDLRTQFSNDVPIRYSEFKVLLFAGMKR